MLCSLDDISPTYDAPGRLVVLASGSGTNFENIVRATENRSLHASVVGLIVNRADAGAIERAKTLGVPHTLISHRDFESREAFDTAVAETIGGWNPDAVILAGWMRLASAPLLDAFPGRILNIHPSLLPSFKGLHAIEQAFDAQVKLTGCSVHVVTPTLDDGPLIGQASVVVGSTLDETEERVHAAEYVLYPRAIQAFLNDYFSS